MKGLLDIASQFGFVLAALFGPICYAGSIVAFFHSAWGFWRQAQPDNPYRDRPWVPVASFVFSGALATFDRLLTKANVSAGSTVVVGLSDAVSYTPTAAPASLLGATPGEFVVNLVVLFQAFFQNFGAMACLWAFLSFQARTTGRGNRTVGSCGAQFVFGMLLINVVTVSQWLVDRFKT